jgi:hypothetical protein
MEIGDLERTGEKAAYFKEYSIIRLEELKRTKITLSQEIRCLARNSNRTTPKYKSEALPLELVYSTTVF